MLEPFRYSLLIKCGEEVEEDGRRRRPFVLIYKASFVIDKDHDNTLTGQVDRAKFKYILEADPTRDFRDCVFEWNPTLEKRLTHEKLEPRPTSEFCCDMFTRATDFFIYDQDLSILLYLGNYPPFGHLPREAEEELKQLRGMHRIPVHAPERKKLIEDAFELLPSGLKPLLSGRPPFGVKTCKVKCLYFRPTGPMSSDAILANHAAELRSCLKIAAKKLLNGEECGV